MKAWLKYKWELLHALKERDKLTAPYDKQYKAAKKAEPNNPHLAEIYNEIDLDLNILDTEIEDIHSRYLFRKVLNLGIPFPYIQPRHKYWTQPGIGGPIVLTTEGKYEIRKLIRAEQKARREPFLAWAGWIVGILGALTGLVSVLKD